MSDLRPILLFFYELKNQNLQKDDRDGQGDQDDQDGQDGHDDQ